MFVYIYIYMNIKYGKIRYSDDIFTYTSGVGKLWPAGASKIFFRK